MNLSVTRATTVESLADSDDLRTILGTTSTMKDAQQTALLKAATEWAERYVGRPLRLQTYAEVVPGFGDFYLLLARRPVRRVVRVFSGTATSDATEYTSTQYGVDEGTGRLYRQEGWPWSVMRGSDPRGGFALDPVEVPPIPYADVPSYYVEYSAGYVGDDGTTSTADGSTSTGRTLPDDIKLAIMAKTGEWQTFGAIGGPIVSQKSVGDLSISYSAGGGASNSKVNRPLPESLLDQYRSIV